MTTFVLHGGNTSTPSPENEHFFSLFTSLVGKPSLRILLCYFARLPEEWEKKSHQDMQQIKEQTSKDVEFTVAQSTQHLVEQLPSHDVLFVAGGYAEYIEPLVPELQNLSSLLDGKVYLGSSMGAFIASTHYVLSSDSADTKTVHQGLGLLPMNILCHWNEEQEQEKERKQKLLEQEESQLPLLFLNKEQSLIIRF